MMDLCSAGAGGLDSHPAASDHQFMKNSALWQPYTQMKSAVAPLQVARTEGSRIHLADGRVLIDGIASWWTACHGYNHPHIRAAVERQLLAMPHVMFGGLTHEPAEQLGARLAAMAPGSLNRVFFSDSGSVAVEVAMKMAVQFWLNRGVRDRSKFVAFRDAYHGDTMGAMSVCDPQTSMHAGLNAYLPEQIFADVPRTPAAAEALDRLLEAEAGQVAAVIVEPLVQGAGGMRFHAPGVLAEIAAAARRHDTLLIADEIFTGFGRTGTLFACEQAAVTPDILCLSKALTGGTLGLAVTLATDAVFDAFWSDDPGAAFMHGPTFMANPLACAAANASLDLFEREPRLQQAADLERALADGLAPCRALPRVVDVRAKGAIGVVQLSAPADKERLRQALIDKGVWVRPFGDIVYLTPALTIAPADVKQLCAAIVAVLKGS
jgi:adenosylmethionine-8-amino-7-oxononanoate aminotransferase